MRVDSINIVDSIAFKSGYPTFGSSGHLSYKPDRYDLVYIGFKPSGILEKSEDGKLNYLA